MIPAGEIFHILPEGEARFMCGRKKDADDESVCEYFLKVKGFFLLKCICATHLNKDTKM